MLTITNLTKFFGKQKVLDQLTYQFNTGYLYVITGVSGSGKSTLLHLISGIINKDNGIIRYNNQDVKKEDVVTILQTAYLFGDLTVAQNINLPWLLNREINKKEQIKLLELFKINNITKRKIRVCSGGERARTNLVRGLIITASIVVVDEPTANVDYENAVLITESLAKIAQHRLIIITSHQPSLFLYPNVKLLKMMHGKLYEI